ncbi:helix-turn-helix domain-containing protein, partial [Psychrobacter sp. HY3-MNA-CIBAN-0198]
MKHYTHLTQEQRYQISALLQAKKSLSEIARIIDCHKSTVSREIKRNIGQRGYRPKQAHRLANAR